ncbi:MAG: hypothetical protein ACPG77_08495, partial [Nannocystaceae bacterium]
MSASCVPDDFPVGSGPTQATDNGASSSGLRLGWDMLTERENHAVSARNGKLTCRVWRRRDIGIERGAELARLLADELESYFKTADKIRGFVFDLRDAPAVSGPVTQTAISNILISAERFHVRIAVVVGPGALQA